MLKRTFAILLIFILVLNTVANTLLFLSLQKEARRRIKEIVKGNKSERKIDTIRVPTALFKNKNVFRFVKEDEFYYKQNLYDIKKIEEKDGQTMIFCINDTFEEQVIRSFLNAEKSEDSQSPLGKVLKLLNKSNFEFILSNIYEVFNKNIFLFFCKTTIFYKSIILPKIDPPPRLQNLYS